MDLVRETKEYREVAPLADLERVGYFLRFANSIVALNDEM